MEEIRVGSEVEFIGPEYPSDICDLCIGSKGKVTERDGYTSQLFGGPKEELITVDFKRPKKVVLPINRVRLIGDT